MEESSLKAPKSRTPGGGGGHDGAADLNEQYPILSDPKSSHTAPSKSCNVIILMAALAFLIAIAGLILIIVLYVLGLPTPAQDQYAIVVDAGSSSSKIQMYSWSGKIKQTNAAVNQTGGTCRTDNGISDYPTNPERSAEQILNCFNHIDAIRNLDKQTVAKTNLYLGATAGMRMLSHSDPIGTQEIFENLRVILKNQGYNITDPVEQIRIITGEEEAINAWITVNYLMEVFGNFSGSEFQPYPITSPETYGALDLGGASTQVTFIPEPTTSNKSIAKLSLFNQKYNVYGYSYLCYGKKQAEIRQLAMVLKKNNFSAVVNNPCGVKSSTLNVTTEEIFQAPCVKGKYAIDTFGEEIIPPENGPQMYQFDGEGNVAQCQKEIIDPFFNTRNFVAVVTPAIRGKFLAFSTFYYVAADLGLAPKTSRANFSQAVNSFCTSAMHEAHARFDPWYCFDGLYILGLLDAYGFNETHWSEIEFVDKVRGTGVSWSLGFMIDQSGHIPGPDANDPKAQENSNLQASNFIILVVLFGLIFLCGILFVVLAFRKVRQARRNRAPSGGSQIA